MARRPWILAEGVTLAVVVAIGIAWLVVHALRGAAASEADRHEALAKRLFDEIEGELSAIVAREEGRSYLEYRFFYVPEGNQNYALVQSELSKPPEDPTVVGWFQLDAGSAEVATPLVPRDNELDLANARGAWDPGRALTVRDELTAALAGLPQRGGGPGEPVQQAAAQAQGDLFLNRGVSKRAGRKEQVYAANAQNLTTYAESDRAISAAQGDPSQVAWVVVSPFAGTRTGDHLVLVREVRAGPVTSRQGVVLRIKALEERLQALVLGGSELGDRVQLAWDGAPPPDPIAYPYVYAHRFAEPFAAMSVVGGIERIPALVGREAWTVRILAGALAVAIGVGGLALYAGVRAELDYARRRSEFVAAVSHELKTPLTTIRMYAEMLRDGMVSDRDRAHAYHHTLVLESDRLGRLIGNVLELARLERGGEPPELVIGALDDAVRDAIEIVSPHARGAGFSLHLEVQAPLPAVAIDRDAVVQIVVNLVDNAVKFAGAPREGGPNADSGRIELALVATDHGVALRVRDHGPGVPAPHVARVFEPFWRGERELTRRTRGTGIGLALVRGLAERMRGFATARNHPAGGFEVEVVLPSA